MYTYIRCHKHDCVKNSYLLLFLKQQSAFYFLPIFAIKCASVLNPQYLSIAIFLYINIDQFEAFILNFDNFWKKISDLFFEKIEIKIIIIKLVISKFHTNMSMTSTICTYKVFSNI